MMLVKLGIYVDCSINANKAIERKIYSRAINEIWRKYTEFTFRLLNQANRAYGIILPK